LDEKFLEDPVEVSISRWLISGRKAAANGSLMRTHPLGIMALASDIEDTFQAAADMSRITHPDPRCVAACCIVTSLVKGLLKGEVLTEEDVDATVKVSYDWVHGKIDILNPSVNQGESTEQAPCLDAQAAKELLTWEELHRHTTAADFEELKLDDASKIGYVYKCLGSAVLALRKGMRAPKNASDTFEKIITELVLQGGDADTNACVAGALLGAWLGYSRLPVDWRNSMTDADWILCKAETLSRMVRVASGAPEAQAMVDTAPDGGRGFFSQVELDQRERDLVFKVLNKSKLRREAEEKQKKKNPSAGVGGWLKSLGNAS
jgi:ADP-ribosylglycohydrolase